MNVYKVVIWMVEEAYMCRSRRNVFVAPHNEDDTSLNRPDASRPSLPKVHVPPPIAPFGHEACKLFVSKSSYTLTAPLQQSYSSVCSNEADFLIMFDIDNL